MRSGFTFEFRPRLVERSTSTSWFDFAYRKSFSSPSQSRTGRNWTHHWRPGFCPTHCSSSHFFDDLRRLGCSLPWCHGEWCRTRASLTPPHTSRKICSIFRSRANESWRLGDRSSAAPGRLVCNILSTVGFRICRRFDVVWMSRHIAKIFDFFHSMISSELREN